MSPTKVGYIITTTDRKGLDTMFRLKGRPERKPGVVLCGSLAQVAELAEYNSDIMRLYDACWKDDILLGCILPWNRRGLSLYMLEDGSSERVQDARGTSCFVIKFGVPSEMIAHQLWQNHGHKLAFASSANPSGKGNRGQLEGVGDTILDGMDLIVGADDYVAAQQPSADEKSRWEQGVMVSMVDDAGKPMRRPNIIRDGLDLERIKAKLDLVYGSGNWGHHHGDYH